MEWRISELAYAGGGTREEEVAGFEVTDPTGRLWRADNIWLAGNGLLNGWSACNPTLTTVALALGTADAIAAHSI